MRIVCAGAGLAAVRLVDELRRLGVEGSITVVGMESVAPYDRPPLSKSVLRGQEDAPPLWGAGVPEGVDLRLNVRATGLDVSAQHVVLDDGELVPYDALVVATGAGARRLPSLDGDDVHYLRTASDVERLRETVRRAGRLTIVGGGFIGCEVAASLRTLDVPVTLVERDEALMAAVLGPIVGRELTDLHMRHGVEVRLGTDNGPLPSGPVLVSVGAVPGSEWLEGSGLRIEKGAVVCDQHGRTSAPGVWAAGDVSAWADASGRIHRHEHWTSAADQAVTVARAIVGAEIPPAQVPYFWSDQYDVKIQMLGTPAPGDEVERVDVDGRTLYLYSNNGALTAAVGLNAARPLMRLRPAVAERRTRDLLGI